MTTDHDHATRAETCYAAAVEFRTQAARHYRMGTVGAAAGWYLQAAGEYDAAADAFTLASDDASAEYCRRAARVTRRAAVFAHRAARAAANDPCPDCGQGWPDGCREDCPSRDE